MTVEVPTGGLSGLTPASRSRASRGLRSRRPSAVFRPPARFSRPAHIISQIPFVGWCRWAGSRILGCFVRPKCLSRRSRGWRLGLREGRPWRRGLLRRHGDLLLPLLPRPPHRRRQVAPRKWQSILAHRAGVREDPDHLIPTEAAMLHKVEPVQMSADHPRQLDLSGRASQRGCDPPRAFLDRFIVHSSLRHGQSLPKSHRAATGFCNLLQSASQRDAAE